MAGVRRWRSPTLKPGTTERGDLRLRRRWEDSTLAMVTVHRQAYGTTTSITHGWHKAFLADHWQLIRVQKNLGSQRRTPLYTYIRAGDFCT